MDWEVAGQTDENGEGVAPTPKSPKRKGGKMKKGLIVVLVIVAIIAFVNIKSCIANQPKNLSWPTTGLATMLPDPPTRKGEVHTNSDDYFSADVDKCSEDQYKAYIESCKELGFTVDASNSTSRYEAYNSDGYSLGLSYYDSEEEMSVTLDAPIEMTEISWPTSGPGSYAPAPASNKGKIDTDSSDHFSAYVGDTSKDAYNAYVDSCITAGFDVDYNKGESSFSGDDASGVHISVSYEGFNTMRVYVDATEMSASAEPAAESEAAAESPAAAEASSSNGDFRQFVDDYEAFMNSYCDFMESYANSSNPVAMAADYASMMSQYAEWTSKFDNYDTSGVSADDLAYYTAAQTRVLERVSKVS